MGKSETKAKEVKELISKNTELKEIITLKFGNSTNRKNNWLDLNNHFFTFEELKYLDYAQDVEVLEEESHPKTKKTASIEKEEENTEKNALTILQNAEVLEKMEFLFNKKNFDKLVNLINQNEKDPTLEKNVIYESELLKQKFKNAKAVTKNIRIFDKIYDNFTKVCQKKDLKIINALNLALYDFVEKYK